jgi:hypothetical protein
VAGPGSDSRLTLIEAVIATADQAHWQRYCWLAIELTGANTEAEPTFAIGSVEWQRQRDQQPTSRTNLPSTQEQAAGRQRLALRGAHPGFAGAPSPFGATGAAAFDEFIASRHGDAPLFAEIDSLEEQLVGAFENAGRSGRFRIVGIFDAAKKEVDPDWFGRMRLDFAKNLVELPDGSVIVGVEVTFAPVKVSGSGRRERPAQAMLREALIALWERGAFTAGTGNERVLALVLQELRLSASDPPYGFKSAETIRKLRKALKMSL